MLLDRIDSLTRLGYKITFNNANGWLQITVSKNRKSNSQMFPYDDGHINENKIADALRFASDKVDN